ncbi:hypothetical protein ABFX02_04G155800 [Erythranthe guttata]
MKEPEIKLFGRMIVLPENSGFVAGVDSSDESNSGSGGVGGGAVVDSDGGGGEAGEVGRSDAEDQLPETKEPRNCHNESDENPETPSINEDDPKAENEQPDPTDGQQKTLKKPDKILPCPRCSSMETKFCYYNNYNVSQPRHFCKSCQRYWTAGGTMRNVPVGAGRRKNKNSAPHCHLITISDNALKPNPAILSFGPDPPAFEPGLDTSEKQVACGSNNAPDVPVNNMNGFPYPVHCIPGVPWPYPVPLPTLCPPGYPIPFYPPAPYWGWNMPWVSGDQTGPTSPLGKHSRNGELINPKVSEKGSESNSIVIPKTLRIDDPEEAAKSSIWETLGIKYNSVNREGLFKALQPKSGGEKEIRVSASAAMQANPAALSRSITFQEGA